MMDCAFGSVTGVRWVLEAFAGNGVTMGLDRFIHRQ